ncbi:MAG: amino acid adenylation domain-containing protein [Methylobacter sp.]|nr:MAG: amino acid adenylation domain-containing protein [Methylobacter sp.]
MNMQELLAHLKQKNIAIASDNGELVIHAAKGVMDSETLALLKQHKEALLSAARQEDSAGFASAPINISPDMLPLVSLSQDEINLIVGKVPQGAANIQDIYPLAPMQEGILFHHLLEAGGDAYLLRSVIVFDGRERLDAFLNALQAVIDRHDVLRSAIYWEGLSQPVQVVHRTAKLPVEKIVLRPEADALQQLYAQTDPRIVRLNLQQAPLFKACIGADPHSGEWLLALLNHHLVCDHVTLALTLAEIRMLLQGQGGRLPPPVPYRNFIAQALAVPPSEHEAYFISRLGDVDEPTAPFGIVNIQGTGEHVSEATLPLSDELALRIRDCARQQGVTAAVLFHVAWALVLARCTGRRDAVFGTVLLGRLQGSTGADRSLGMFINTLPIRIPLANANVRETVGDTYRNLSELLNHEQASLALAQRCSSVPNGMPLFTSLFNYRHSDDSLTPFDWEGMRILGSEERTNYPVTLSVNDSGKGFGLTAQCVEGIDPVRIAAYLKTAIEELVGAEPMQAIESLNILPTEELQQLLFEFNDPVVPTRSDRLMHRLFEDQVEKTPDALAVVYEKQGLTYAELNRRANQLAHHLSDIGIRPDDRVAICLERSLEMVVGLLGIVKAGGAYVPLDPGYPQDRLDFMLRDVGAQIVLSQEACRGKLAVSTAAVLCLDSDWELIAQAEDSNPDISVIPENLAYCIYTSGSTGQPKAACVPHQGIVNRLQWMQQQYRLNADDAVLQKTPYSFDVSVWEFFWPLMNGARLVVVRPDAHKDGSALIDIINSEHITTVHFVPSMLQAFIDTPGVENCLSLKRVICSGEALPADLVARFQQKLPAELHNLYGPTEASVDVSYWACLRGRAETAIPIGRPIANIRLYILDRQLNPAPLGTSGELHIGGVGLARGYLNRPELTAEKFIPNPFAEQGERLYKTGDWVRYRPDGNIDYLGRIDHQVKIRGFRIELGEIEARLLEHPDIKEAVVLAREDQPGDKRLVAYLVAAAKDAFDVDTVKLQLKNTLPEYMVPGVFVLLDRMPLNANGKLERKRLPQPDIGAMSAKHYVAPRTATEDILAGIWAEVLGVEQVGVEDNFFELGGHSLLATQLVSRICLRFNINLQLKTLFDTTSVAQLAAKVDLLAWAKDQREAVQYSAELELEDIEL